MNLHGEFVDANENPYVHQSDLVQSLSEHFYAIRPSFTRIKLHYSHHFDKKLKTC